MGRNVLAIGVAACLAVVLVSCAAPSAPPAPPAPAPPAAGITSSTMAFRPPQPAGPRCDPTLWQHVFAGHPRRFSKPQDRPHVLKDCVEGTGVIDSAKPEADCDFHLRLR